MSNNTKLGKMGESIAESYLKSKGYEILTKNYYTPYGEIDIITEKDNCIIFVEVKLRRSKTYGDILEQINYSKKEKLIKSAYYFLEQKNNLNKDMRIDFIALFKESGLYKVTHLENVVETND